MKTLLPVLVGVTLALASAAGSAQETDKDVLKLSIERKSLRDALNDWAQQTGNQLIAEIKGDFVAPKIEGRLTAQDALEQLLQGTPLTYQWMGERLVAVKEKWRVVPAALQTTQSEGEQRPQLRIAKLSGDEWEGGRLAANDPRVAQNDARASSARGALNSERSLEELEEVLVTGTHIRGSNNGASPVLTIDRKQIERSGLGSVGEIVRTLPQNFNGGQNPGVVGARGTNQFTISGASTANLRGLGADSTLTLVNGHRLAYDAFQNGVDTSIIPLAAVERIEVLGDGASAQYGSDAVAGVVNVILRRDFDGLETRVRLADSTDGGGSQQSYSQLAGANWDGGNVAGNFEYSKGKALYSDERSISSAAVSPTMLFPASERYSLFATTHQSLAEHLTFFADGLYTKRTHDDVNTQFFDFGGGFGLTAFNKRHTKVEQYGATAGLSLDLPKNGWRMTLEGTIGSGEDIDSGSTLLDTGDIFVAETTYRNKLTSIELKADGPLFNIPSGTIRSALGGGYRGEKFEQLDSSPASTSIGGDIIANRDVTYVFGEASIPIVPRSATRAGMNGLDLVGAIRHEDHSDFGSSTTPKLGLIYSPTADLSVRGTWARSFRAPGLYYQQSQAVAVLRPASFAGGPDGPETVIFTRGGNADLKPETANSYTIGFDFSPTGFDGFKLGTTFYKVNYRNRIVTPIDNVFAALSDPINAPFVVQNPSEALQSTFLAAPFQFVNQFGLTYDPANVIAIIRDQYANAATQNIRGVDVNSRFTWVRPYGNFDFDANLSWLHIEQRLLSTAPSSEISGTVFNPSKFRARGSVAWQKGDFNTTASLNYVGSAKDAVNDPPADVRSWLTFDFQFAYSAEVSWDLVRRFDVALSAINLFNREPPRISTSTTVDYPIGYDSTNASALGRFISAEIAVRW